MINLLNELQTLAGGATGTIEKGRVQGVWNDLPEFSIRVEVGLKVDSTKADAFDALIGLIEKACEDFGQECIYAVLGGSRAVLVRRRKR